MYIDYVTGRYLILIVAVIIGVSVLGTYAVTNHYVARSGEVNSTIDYTNEQTHRSFDRHIFKIILSYYGICLVLLYVWKFFCSAQEFGNAWFYGIMWRLSFDLLLVLVAFNLLRETPRVCNSHVFDCVFGWWTLQLLAGLGLVGQLVGSFIGLSVGSRKKLTL